MNLQNVLPWYSSQELREQNQETVFLCTSSLIKIHVIIPSENPRGSRRGEVREGEGGGGCGYFFFSWMVSNGTYI